MTFVCLCALVCVRVCGSVCVMLQALSDRVEARTAQSCIIISAAVCRARAVVFSRSLVHMGTCDVKRSCRADVPADLYQYIGDPRAPGDPLHGTLGYRQPQDPAASQAFQAASLAARGLSTAQASSSSRQPAAASAASAAAGFELAATVATSTAAAAAARLKAGGCGTAAGRGVTSGVSDTDSENTRVASAFPFRLFAQSHSCPHPGCFCPIVPCGRFVFVHLASVPFALAFFWCGSCQGVPLALTQRAHRRTTLNSVSFTLFS